MSTYMKSAIIGFWRMGATLPDIWCVFDYKVPMRTIEMVIIKYQNKLKALNSDVSEPSIGG